MPTSLGQCGSFERKTETISRSAESLVDDPAEHLAQLLHRSHLMRDVYSKPYDPESIAKQVADYCTANCARSFVDEARRILEEDSLTTFTKVDLCLNNRLIERMCAAPPTMAFDISEAEYFPVNLNPTNELASADSKNIQKLVENLIQCLLREGWIYPATEPIGGHPAFCTTFGTQSITQHVRNAIAACQPNATDSQELGVSVFAISKILRREKPREYSQLTLPALARVLNVLESESKIYQTTPRRYRLS